ncbi:MAG: ABC transporter permease [Myxococcales bacterium]
MTAAAEMGVDAASALEAAPGRGLRRLGWSLAVLGIWEAVARLGPWPAWIFPPPTAVAASLWELARHGVLLPTIGQSLARLAVGYGISLAIGVPLGLAVGRSRIAEELFGAPLLGLQALPSICWLPVAILWFGLSETAILFVVVMGSALSVAIATQSGVRTIHPLLLRAARTLGAKGLRLYTTAILPASLPSLLSGAKLGWTFAWRSLFAAELLYVKGGLGQLLQASRELNDVARVFAVMSVILVLGLCMDRWVFAPLERSVRLRYGLV